MQFQFTESDYSDAFKFGGRLTLRAESSFEVEKIITHFKLFNTPNDIEALKAKLVVIESGVFEHILGTDKRPIFEVDSALEVEFSTPYQLWAERCFGFRETLPDMEIPRQWNGLKYTNYQERLYVDSGHICFRTFVSSEPWNGKSAQEYAEFRAFDIIQEEFGFRKIEPEMIQIGNGTFKENPNYLKRHKPTPLASNSLFKRAFFAWWVLNRASDAQKEIISCNAEIAAGASYMSAFTFDRYESHIFYAKSAKDYKSVSFAEFAAMGVSQ